jgi:hypothetical protein
MKIRKREEQYSSRQWAFFDSGGDKQCVQIFQKHKPTIKMNETFVEIFTWVATVVMSLCGIAFILVLDGDWALEIEEWFKRKNKKAS